VRFPRRLGLPFERLTYRRSCWSSDPVPCAPGPILPYRGRPFPLAFAPRASARFPHSKRGLPWPTRRALSVDLSLQAALTKCLPGGDPARCNRLLSFPFFLGWAHARSMISNPVVEAVGLFSILLASRAPQNQCCDRNAVRRVGPSRQTVVSQSPTQLCFLNWRRRRMPYSFLTVGHPGCSAGACRKRLYQKPSPSVSRSRVPLLCVVLPLFRRFSAAGRLKDRSLMLCRFCWVLCSPAPFSAGTVSQGHAPS